MKIALLIHGFHRLERDEFGFPLDARAYIGNLRENIVDPIRNQSPENRVVVSTHHSDCVDEILGKISPDYFEINDPIRYNHVEPFKNGIRCIMERDSDVDAVVALQFNIALKRPITHWNVAIDRARIYFPWKEYEYSWRDHRRVGDAIHIIGAEGIEAFYRAMSMCELAGRAELHMMYYFLRPMHRHMAFICDGYWDSNTLYGNPECENPLYWIPNRPKLTNPAPYRHLIPEELKVD